MIKTFTKAYAINKLIFDFKKQQQTTILTYQKKHTYQNHAQKMSSGTITMTWSKNIQKFPKQWNSSAGISFSRKCDFKWKRISKIVFCANRINLQNMPDINKSNLHQYQHYHGMI